MVKVFESLSELFCRPGKLASAWRSPPFHSQTAQLEPELVSWRNLGIWATLHVANILRVLHSDSENKALVMAKWSMLCCLLFIIICGYILIYLYMLLLLLIVVIIMLVVCTPSRPWSIPWFWDFWFFFWDEPPKMAWCIPGVLKGVTACASIIFHQLRKTIRQSICC